VNYPHASTGLFFFYAVLGTTPIWAALALWKWGPKARVLAMVVIGANALWCLYRLFLLVSFLSRITNSTLTGLTIPGVVAALTGVPIFVWCAVRLYRWRSPDRVA
jgi:hypothetical protein